MMYRRNRVPGGTYFFTVALARRGSDILVREVAALRTAWAQTWMERPFTTDAVVVMPDHLHVIWTLPDGDADFSTRWRLIKSRFTRAVAAPDAPSVWQNRFWEHTIRDATDLQAHRRICWFDPVRHGLVRAAQDWQHGSYTRDLRHGLVGDNGEGQSLPEAYGEPHWDDPVAVTPLKVAAQDERAATL